MSWSNVLWNVAYVAPQVIVYLLGVVLGLVTLKKYKPASLYAVIGGVIAAVVSLSGVVARELLRANANNAGGDIEAAATLRRFITIGANVVEAVGMAMIVFAVFVGRKAARREDDDDLPTPRASRHRS